MTESGSSGNPGLTGNVKTGRIADLTRSEGPLTFSLTGQISNVILGFDDGASPYLRYGDNGAAPTLINITASWKATDALSLGFVYETNYPYEAGSLMTQDNAFVSPPGFDTRQLEITLFHNRLGKLSLGQGHLAGDSITQSDLSGTALAGHNTIGDHGGAFVLRDAAKGIRRR